MVYNDRKIRLYKKCKIIMNFIKIKRICKMNI